jgi:hypothetical protein
MSSLDKAQFKAFIPPLQSAIRTGGDGGRVTLEVPETDMAEFAKLIAMRGEQLQVTVEIFRGKGDAPRKIHI